MLMSAPQPQTLRFPTLALDQVIDALDRWPADREPVVNFAPGQSSFNVWEALGQTPPALPVERVVRYGELSGSSLLRERISQGLSHRLGVSISPRQVCITNGGSEAIMLALHLLMRPGGRLLMSESCYPGYRPLHRFFAAERRPVALRPDCTLDVAALQAQWGSGDETAGSVLLVNSPSNPFGTVLSAPELAELASLPMPIIFDEVYQPLSLGDEPVPSAMVHTDRHFVVGSFAKSLAVPGLRLGYLISPLQWADEIVNIKALVSVCSSSAAQHVMEHLLLHWDELEAQHRRHLRRSHDHFFGVCQRLGLPMMSRPQAGLFATLALPRSAPLDSLSVALELALHHGIGVVPSTDFQDQGPGFLRMNFSITHDLVEPGLERLAAALRSLDCRV